MKTLLAHITAGNVATFGAYNVHSYNDGTLGVYKSGSGLVLDPAPKMKATVANLKKILALMDSDRKAA